MKKFITVLAAAAMAALPSFAEETTEAIFENYLSIPAEGENIDYLNGMYIIAFPDASVVSDNSDNPAVECTLRNESTGESWELMWSTQYEFLTNNPRNGFEFIFKIGDITDKGYYTVTFPAGAFTTDGVDSPDFVTRFSIGMPNTGVDVISLPEDAHTVYDMEGRRLSGDLSRLPAGLYIIDGRKTLLR